MKIQSSRNSRQAAKDYSSVTHQQGRMLTDSDLTEQALLSRDRLSNALRDVIGSGTPKHDGLINISEDGQLQLSWGRVYVDGVPAKIKADASATDSTLFDYAHQLYYPQAPALPESGYRFYVDVWERSVNWLQDGMLRDPGLHGADTTARTQTVAQVKWCDALLDPLCTEQNPAIGNARLNLVLRSLSSAADPCDPCAEELELNAAVGNYLFRVEVHDVHYDDHNRPDVVVLKWSSENGAEAYKTTDLPPDFVAAQYVYEYFDDISEMHLGNHLARDAGGSRSVDGQRASLVSDFSAVSAAAKAYTRRWDGWCRIEKSAPGWQLTEGAEGLFDLSSGIGAGKPGHVEQGGEAVAIELSVISLSLTLAEFDLIAGDYWTVPVRESVHQQGEVLLEGEITGEGALPEGEPHHYMLLVDVSDDATKTMSLPAHSECDSYNACKPAQFPSLTDLHADDICYDNQQCEMPEVSTVQGAIDHLCQKNDLPWHNKHLHGWGIVCGLALQCNRDKPQTVLLKPGYALDNQGRDMVINEARIVDVPALLEEAEIAVDNLNRDQEICLYLDHASSGNAVQVKAELAEAPDSDWKTILADSLLMDFYQDCVVDLLDIFRGEIQGLEEVEARCAITECGKKHLPSGERRTLSISNLIYNDAVNETKSVLNVSSCEHALLEDLFNKLKDKLRSKTFCGQFRDHAFPDYPFSDQKLFRATWFTPERFDHIRLHPDNVTVFAWQRESARIYVFKQLKEAGIGDLTAYIDLPELEDGSITDLVIDSDNRLFVAAIVHKEDSVIYHGQLDQQNNKQCQLQIDWKKTFICGGKMTQLSLSPWSSKHLYAAILCEGIHLIETTVLEEKEKIELKPVWAFPCSGQFKFDVNNDLIIASAYQQPEKPIRSISCDAGFYNSIALFDGRKPDLDAPVKTLPLFVNNRAVQGNDDFDIAVTAANEREEVGNPRLERIISTQLAYIVINDNDQKSLCVFDLSKTTINKNKITIIEGNRMHSFEGAEKVAIRFINDEKIPGILASRYAMHDLQFIPSNIKLYKAGMLTSIPVQAGPVELLISEKNNQVVILNHLGQSLSLFNLQFTLYQQQREVLAQYRADMLSAYYNLASGLMQYLKDCFCQHLLVNCPENNEQDKVYLGCLSIEENQIYQICNFSKRKYVKTFPTVSYWLSIIPIEGVVSWVVEKMCCYIFPDISNVRGNVIDNNVLSISALQANMAKAAVKADPAKMLSNLSSMGTDLLRRGVGGIIDSGYSQKGQSNAIVDRKYNYKPGVYIEIKKEAFDNEQLLEIADGIEHDRLINRQNVDKLTVDIGLLKQEKEAIEVRFAAIAEEKKSAQQEVTALQSEIVTIKSQTSQVESHFNEVNAKLSALANEKVAALEAQVVTLSQQKNEVETRFTQLEAAKLIEKQEVASLKSEINSLKLDKRNSDSRFIELEKGLSDLSKIRKEVQPIIEGAKPVSSLEGMTPANLKILEDNNITTVKQLAEMNTVKLKGLGINDRTAASINKNAKNKLK